MLKSHEANQIVLHGDRSLNFNSDVAHITPKFYNIILDSAECPNVNPVHPTTHATVVSKNVVDSQIAINTNTQNTRTRYNLRNQNRVEYFPKKKTERVIVL